MAKDGTVFAVSMNVGAGKTVELIVTYEELLDKKDGFYTQTIDLQREGNETTDLHIEVKLEESLALKTFKCVVDSQYLIESKFEQKEIRNSQNTNTAHCSFHPFQFNTDGKLMVKYDVDTKGKDHEIHMTSDGHIIHFFSPISVKNPIPKYVVFVLDISGSMGGQKYEQLKQAMEKVLEDMRDEDEFSIVLFNSNVSTWSSSRTNKMVIFQ